MISRTPPDFKSMQYDFLRAEGLKHIEELAGKIWTDYNLSDPGISILEVLSYVITDLGYRTAYPTKDLIAQDPDAAQTDIKNFYTARHILPMAPVTFNDYRKLLIDTDVHDPSDVGAEFVGVKNAWIDISTENEIPFYIQRSLDTLDYSPEVMTAPERVDVKVLYNILLELGSCDKFGDMNENTLEGIITLTAPTTPAGYEAFNGLKIKVNVEFPRWDEAGVDWYDTDSIKAHIRKLTLTFPKMPQGFTLNGYGLYPDKSVWTDVRRSPVNSPPFDNTFIENAVQALMYTDTDSLLALYKQKVQKTHQIIDAVRARLMANRNLCEDFFKISALKIEEIAVCADVELTADADVEETLAKIYFGIGNFLAPTVYFYTLGEMYAKGLRTEEIFEGPPLNHGFIDTDELEKAGRRKVIHVSDLIHIIMEIPGVVAVKSIQIANVPEDNVDNIASVAVRWCLDLAFEHNYVPRLSTDLSKITFYKELLPFKANEDEVDGLLARMIAQARPQKMEDAVLDLPVPQGEYKNIEEYVSTQDEFPLVYGIGPEGLPATATEERKAQAKQLKGFLMFFDQLLADYLSQLAHVKDLFSMNEERDAYGNFIIDKSYFTQSLVPSVTGVNELLVNPALYPIELQEMTEDPTLFDQRRNKFLDHLMARFSEQFTDYAMLVYKLDGKKAPDDLLQDKLEFLNAYPEISGGRFKAMNYESPCDLWSVNNVSGLEKRVSMLTGIDVRTAADLHFHDNFAMDPSFPSGYTITDSASAVVLTNAPGQTFAGEAAWKLGMEEVIINGVISERYQISDASGSVIDPAHPGTPNPPYTVRLVCGGGDVLGVMPGSYASLSLAEQAIADSIATIADEFYNNVESNRNNLTAAIGDYFKLNPSAPVVDMVPETPTYTIDFSLYDRPFPDTDPSALDILYGTYVGKGIPKLTTLIIDVPDTIGKTITLSGDFSDRINVNDKVNIKDSDANDGDYNVDLIQFVHTPTGANTNLTLSGGPAALSTNTPLGTLCYYSQTEAELQQIADDSVEETLFGIALNGISVDHYTYGVVSGGYRFNIGDRCGDTLATSVEKNFNEAMADIAADHPGGIIMAANKIRIEGNDPANNGDHTVTSASATDDTVDVIVNDVLTEISGGTIFFDDDYPVMSVDRFTRYFEVNTVLNRVLFPDERISIGNSASQLNDDQYTIKKVVITPANTSLIYVNEPINSGAAPLGDLYYSKTFDITQISAGSSSSTISFKPGVEVKAAEEMAEYIRGRFFSHEGMHLVEHVLLRPKVREDVYVPITQPLSTDLFSQGLLEFTKTFEILSADKNAHTFYVADTWTPSGEPSILNDLYPLMNITIKGSQAEINDGKYKVIAIGTTPGGDVYIRVYEDIPDDTLPAGRFGNLYYHVTMSINSTDIESITNISYVTVIGGFADQVDVNSSVTITLSQDGINNGTYGLSEVTEQSGSGRPPARTLTAFMFNTVLKHYEDHFLQVNLNDDCSSCRVEDPYSFIASVVMPYWQGRFLNQDFRAYFERTLRLECPAHLVLNICWVSNAQMREFEYRYKAWLVEDCKKIKDKAALSDALNALIDILLKLRSVYPSGTLHNCEDTDTLQNSIILNRTALGTIQI